MKFSKVQQRVSKGKDITVFLFDRHNLHFFAGEVKSASMDCEKGYLDLDPWAGFDVSLANLKGYPNGNTTRYKGMLVEGTGVRVEMTTSYEAHRRRVFKLARQINGKLPSSLKPYIKFAHSLQGPKKK